MEYQYYHTHPINKLIHFFCIPLIVITSANFISKCKFFGINFYGSCLISLLINYYINYGFITLAIMSTYYCIIDYYSEKWVKRKYWFIESCIIFTLAWILQFIGHYIEGSRPALIDSISTAISQAPLFSIMYLFEIIGYVFLKLTNIFQ